MHRIPLEEIKKARERITPYTRITPCLPVEAINKLTGREVWLKCESLQKTGSFKIRGAANFILENSVEAKRHGVVAASAGNHAQGVAAIAKALNIPATIVMPVSTPAIKIQNTANYGAEVKLVGNVYDESFDHAKKISQERGAVLVHPFHDPVVMAGQGTVGLEIAECPFFKDIEAAVISIGGGGLISGIASALKTLNPRIKIYGVTAQNAPATYQTFKNNRPAEVEVKFTLAEGVAPKKSDQYMLDYLKDNVDDVFSLSEESIAHAITLLAEHGKLVAEGAGALPVAALLEGKIPEKKVVAVISGGNLDLFALSAVVQRGLVEQGRLARLLITISDRPGSLANITQILAEKRVNIHNVFHQRATLLAGVGETQIEVDIETRGKEHTEEVLSTLIERGFRVQRL